MSDEIVISAVTYPLGNDADEATGFLKYTVINNVLQHSPLSLGESISRGLLTGKGIQLLRNYEYARRKFSLGLPHSGLSYSSPTKLRTPLINVLKSLHPGHDIQLQGTEVGPCRFSNWCMRYLEENYGYDPELGFTRPPENTAPDAPVSCDYQFINPGVDSWGNPYWIYNSSISAGLTVMWENKAGEVKGVMFNPNLWPMPREAKDNPADTFWPNFTSLQTAYRTIKTYPTSTTRSTRAKLESDFDHVSTVVSQVVRNGDIQETITVTTMTVSGNTTTLLVEKTVKVISRMKYYFYWVDTAPGAPGYQSALDNWLSKIPYSSPYFPSVPLRVNNQDMTTEDKRDTSLYKTSKKLLDKFNIDILELADQINDNESIKDIDYAHVMFGVPIHAEAPECLEYLWRFFTDLQGLDPGEFTDPPFDPDNGDYYHPDMSVLHIFYQQAPHDYPNIRIRWRWIERSLFDGVIAPGAKPGDIKMVLGAKATRVFKYHSPEKGKREVSEDDSTIYLRRQLDASNYEELEIRGLVYNNYIYGGKWQVTAAWDQINDPEEVSGFLVPLNQQVLRALPLPVVTDLAYHVPHIVFNCYTKVKKKWYQQGWFKYLMIIIAVVITVMTAIVMISFSRGGVLSIAMTSYAFWKWSERSSRGSPTGMSGYWVMRWNTNAP